jgi:hypothetical protein
MLRISREQRKKGGERQQQKQHVGRAFVKHLPGNTSLWTVISVSAIAGGTEYLLIRLSAVCCSNSAPSMYSNFSRTRARTFSEALLFSKESIKNFIKAESSMPITHGASACYGKVDTRCKSKCVSKSVTLQSPLRTGHTHLSILLLCR